MLLVTLWYSTGDAVGYLEAYQVLGHTAIQVAVLQCPGVVRQGDRDPVLQLSLIQLRNLVGFKQSDSSFTAVHVRAQVTVLLTQWKSTLVTSCSGKRKELIKLVCCKSVIYADWNV